MTNLNQLLQRLCETEIEFVIIGGFAAMLHGSALLTRDLDVCAVLTDENVERLRNALKELKPVHRFTPQRLSFLDVPPPGTALKNLYIETELGPVDILTSVKGVGDFQRLADKAREITLFGKRCLIISLEDLISAKEAVGREKDLLAAKELRAIAAMKAQKQKSAGPEDQRS